MRVILFLPLIAGCVLLPRVLPAQVQPDPAAKGFTLQACVQFALKYTPALQQALLDEEMSMPWVDPHSLRLDKRRVHSNPGHVFWQNRGSHPAVGMLFIDFATRRRYRVNGQAGGPADQPLITVQQAYVNCPKYIARRSVSWARSPFTRTTPPRGKPLPAH